MALDVVLYRLNSYKDFLQKSQILDYNIYQDKLFYLLCEVSHVPLSS
jgi:hypothetical protein